MAQMNMADKIGGAGQTGATESIATRSGLKLLLEKRADERQIDISLRACTQRPCILHWGLRERNLADWHILPPSLWPEGTVAVGANAMQTPFRRQDGEGRVAIALRRDAAYPLIEFVLFFPEERRWDNNGRRNYQIAVPTPEQPGISPLAELKAQVGAEELLFEHLFEVQDLGRLAVGVTKGQGRYRVRLFADVPGQLALHWGIARRSPHEWLEPPEALRPGGTILWQGHTAQTPFAARGGLNRLELEFSEAQAPLGIQFVLKQGEANWLNHRGGNFYVPIHVPPRQWPGTDPGQLGDLTGRIVQAETGSGSWTLMHRYNLCYDLLERAQGNVEALALLYVWMRFSATRQLTWQRNYNTKPRELAHAQDRLTGRLAELYRGGGGRPLLRLLLSTIGRGGDGQRVRDEILQIMHRHHIKEVSGHFTEEWHQKLHNNTTPDDVVICEAYLEFLRSNGNLERFYQKLQEGGVSRERLESFERPIVTQPDFVPHLKDALIHDFENFLKVLKAVHSATDLETALPTTRDQLDGETQGLLWDVWNHRNDPPEGLTPLVDRITESRRRVSHILHHGQQLRPLLYLDLALEQLVRVVIERNLHQHLSGDQLVDLVGRVLENVTLSYEDAELATCLRHWEQLSRTLAEPRFSPGWSLHAKSVADRIGRALSDWTDRLYQMLQPKAECLGQAFHAESWTITLFSEEVVRGSSLGFVLSMLLHQLGRVLRQRANLGVWQIVSRGQGSGQIEVVEALRSVQGKQFKNPTVVIADKVAGDEELPQQVVAVIAPDVTDLVSHVAVRARNARVLFASCSDSSVLAELKSLRGRRLHLEVTAAGDVIFREVKGGAAEVTVPMAERAGLKLARPRFTHYAITMGDFDEKAVGGKSCSQARLRGKLPDWIHLPPSVALPFGVMEKVLTEGQNQQAARRQAELAKNLKTTFNAETAGELRESVLSMVAPEALKSELNAAFSKAGLPWPGNWESAWRCITQVWASKWNERAVLSRRRVGIKDEDLVMAVLIQPVVEADYAFVIHTVNPSTGNRNELYAEVVLGLGETLVGNYPGRALSFVYDKPAKQARLVSFPSKSMGLYGSGLIFRSDSNGEDLAAYAGAGLYDSVLLNPPRRMQLDYAEEPLVWDESFRNEVLDSVARAGLEIETAMGSPQDIEGAFAKGEYFVVQTRPQVGGDGG